MNEPTEADIGDPVVNEQTETVWQIARRNGTIGVWTKYRGFRERVNWQNWRKLKRLPLDGLHTPPGPAGGMT